MDRHGVPAVMQNRGASTCREVVEMCVREEVVNPTGTVPANHSECMVEGIQLFSCLTPIMIMKVRG